MEIDVVMRPILARSLSESEAGLRKHVRSRS